MNNDEFQAALDRLATDCATLQVQASARGLDHVAAVCANVVVTAVAWNLSEAEGPAEVPAKEPGA